jgi:hypothetical protein
VLNTEINHFRNWRNAWCIAHQKGMVGEMQQHERDSSAVKSEPFYSGRSRQSTGKAIPTGAVLIDLDSEEEEHLGTPVHSVDENHQQMASPNGKQTSLEEFFPSKRKSGGAPVDQPAKKRKWLAPEPRPVRKTLPFNENLSSRKGRNNHRGFNASEVPSSLDAAGRKVADDAPLVSSEGSLSPPTSAVCETPVPGKGDPQSRQGQRQRSNDQGLSSGDQ